MVLNSTYRELKGLLYEIKKNKTTVFKNPLFVYYSKYKHGYTFGHRSIFKMNSQNCSSGYPLLKLHKCFRFTEQKSRQGSR